MSLTADADNVVEDIQALGPPLRDGLQTTLVNFAMGLVGGTAHQKTIALKFLNTIQGRRDNPIVHHAINDTIGDNIEMNFPPEMDDDKLLNKWWNSLKDRKLGRIMFEFPEHSSDEEEESNTVWWKTIAPISAARDGFTGGQPLSFADVETVETPRLASRLKTETEDGTAGIQDTLTYQERNRSPLDRSESDLTF